MKINRPRPSWYTDPKFIRPKTNHSWTDQEIKEVYALRQTGFRIKRIIKVLGLNVEPTQVYNILRMQKKVLGKKCVNCGHLLTEKEHMNQIEKHFPRCTKCQKKNKDHKDKTKKARLKKGLCVICGTLPHLKDKTCCYRCISATHRRRYIHGMCGHCNSRPISNHSVSLCDPCLKESRMYSARRTKQLEKVRA